ncbi:HAD family hydrolase [Fibrella sp. WM1]|uniref:HAD family hydrolase n=1 Tax=Fibrella musci TaxID=3242485 RepID=UPI0035221172
MPPRFINQFDVLLFDLMDTLMFGGNRFSADEDYAQTYRQLGGTYLSDRVVQQVIHDTWCRMSDHYGDPAYYDNFRPADQYIAETLTAMSLPQTELTRLHDVFARHELGHVPDSHCQALRQLAQTHRLGLVSNLWSGKALFVEAFAQCGIHDLFEYLVFSSDHSSIKPAPTLFQLMLGTLGVAPHQALFIGDSVERDMVGAAGLGMQAVLVGPPNPAYSGLQVRDVSRLVA